MEMQNASVKFFGTRDVARLLGLTATCLSKAVWDGRVPEPSRGPGRAFLWNIGDVEAASRVLRGRGIEDLDLA